MLCLTFRISHVLSRQPSTKIRNTVQRVFRASPVFLVCRKYRASYAGAMGRAIYLESAGLDSTGSAT